MKIYTNVEEFPGGKRIVMTTGTFDGVHIGHRAILKRLREYADQKDGETLLFTFDPHPRMVLFPEDHGLRLLSTRNEKVQLLENAGIDHVIFHPFSEDFARLSPLEYVRNILVNGIGVDKIVVGYDHRFGRNRKGDFRKLTEFSEMFQFEVEEIPAHEVDEINVSSTKIREALKKGMVQTANQYLGYNYSVSGIVIEGDGIGKTLGYPTANIRIDNSLKLIPGNGVYAVWAHCEGNVHAGMMNQGVRPTITTSGEQRMEVHLLKSDIELYGKEMRVEFVERMRGEQHFSDKEALMVQLKKDKRKALEILS